MSRPLSNAPAAVAVVLLGAWLGAGLFFSAVVAPAAFRLLPARALAGALVGGTLPLLFGLGAAIGLIVVGLSATGTVGATRTVAEVCGMISAACCAMGIYLGYRIDALRARLAMPLESLVRGDPLRQTFGRMHVMSVLALGLAMTCAVVAVVALSRRNAQDVRGTGTTDGSGANC